MGRAWCCGVRGSDRNGEYGAGLLLHKIVGQAGKRSVIWNGAEELRWRRSCMGKRNIG